MVISLSLVILFQNGLGPFCARPCFYASPGMLTQVYLLTLEMPLREDLLAPSTFLQTTEGVFPSSQGGVVFGGLLFA